MSAGEGRDLSARAGAAYSPGTFVPPAARPRE